MLVSDAHLLLPTLFFSLVSLSKSVLLMEQPVVWLRILLHLPQLLGISMVSMLAVSGEVWPDKSLQHAVSHQ